MRKVELDRLLEKTVADALGVRLSHRRSTVSAKVRTEVKASSRRPRNPVRELHLA